MAAAPVRMPEREDEAEWLRLRQLLWPDCIPEQHEVEMASLIADGDRAAVFVSPRLSGETLAGFVEVALRPWIDACPGSPAAFVEAFYVFADERDRRVGEALLEAAEAWAAERGCRVIAAEALVDDQSARDLHRLLGYEEAGTRVRLRKAIAPGPGEEHAG